MTSLDFGPLVLGGNVFGWTSSRDESFEVLDAFVAAGGRSIDTADSYSQWAPGHQGGESEVILGDWLASRKKRDDIVIATKVFAMSARPGLSAANVRAACDDSLRRLRTDRIDLYFAHRDDPKVPQEEVVSVFHELVKAGKIREVGTSNWSADRIKSAFEIARGAHLTPITVAQDHYNLVARDLEKELVPTLLELDIVEMPYYALAAGFLSGKYRPGHNVDSPRAPGASKYLDDARSVALLGVVEEIAAARKVSAAAVAIAWLRQQPAVASPIASARTKDQLTALLESFTLTLSADELARLK